MFRNGALQRVWSSPSLDDPDPSIGDQIAAMAPECFNKSDKRLFKLEKLKYLPVGADNHPSVGVRSQTRVGKGAWPDGGMVL